LRRISLQHARFRSGAQRFAYFAEEGSKAPGLTGDGELDRRNIVVSFAIRTLKRDCGESAAAA